VSEYDIARLAKHFGLPVSVARERFTYTYRGPDGEEEQVLRHKKDHVYKSTCRFFDQDQRRCTVYPVRPNVCRRYPYGNVCGYYSFLKFERQQQNDEEFIPSA
jgi:Fe-S-cluster containining protein